MKVSTLSFLAFPALLVTVLAEVQFVNEFDKVADMTCPRNQYMYHIYSEHNNHFEDRRWAFKCRSGKTENCEWSGYENDFDGLLVYACPGNKVITGINSYHDNGPEDRRFKFQCCDVVNKATSNCYLTKFANDLDKPLSLDVDKGKAIKGVGSCHDSGTEDRRFKFYVCELTRQYSYENYYTYEE